MRGRTISPHGITAVVGLVLALLRPAPASAQAGQRPISDFVNAQGTTMVFTPPVPDQLGSSSPAQGGAPGLFALVDYAGKAAGYLQSHGIFLGTTIQGSVSERPLADGRAEVTVDLYTTNALTWAISFDPNGPATQFNSNPLLFGFRAPDLVADATRQPGLGQSHLYVVFDNTAPGAPLPDLVNAFVLGNAAPGQALLTAAFRATATGPLHPLAGLGPEGTPGLVLVSQTGLIATAGLANPNSRVARDAFPAELVQLRRIGQ